MSRRLVVAAALSVIVAGQAWSQAVIETSTSTIEILGLRRWTLSMITDSLAVYAPKDSLTGHACAAILRGKLHFADASVTVFTGMNGPSSKKYVGITIVEPQDSARIHYKPELRDSLPTRSAFAAAFAEFRENNELAQSAIQDSGFYDTALSSELATKYSKLSALHGIIATHRSPKDFADALQTLETDGSISNRVMSTLILANFADQDSAWWALVDAQRTPTGIVAATAQQILNALSRRAPRPVDWTPVADRLRYIIDGTNLFSFDGTLKILTATSVSPRLAAQLLAGGGAIVRAKLHSGNTRSKGAATAFLSQLSGLPATTDVSAFEKWMDQLDKNATASQ